MATDFRKVLWAVTPHGKPEIVEGFAAALPSCIAYAAIDGVDAIAVFIGQCAEESAGFRTVVEYASGRAYEGRKDLGNTQNGDGVRYKGRGLIQLTGRANYAEFTADLASGIDYVAHPECVAQFPEAASAAAWYWKKRRIGEMIASGPMIADKCRIATKLVNGGYNGLSVREALTRGALAALSGCVTVDRAQRAAQAIANPDAALLAAAANEKAALKAKTAIAVVATAPAVAVSPAVQTAGAVPAWALCVGVALTLGAIAWAIFAIRRHASAIRTLTDAAKDA